MNNNNNISAPAPAPGPSSTQAYPRPTIPTAIHGQHPHVPTQVPVHYNPSSSGSGGLHGQPLMASPTAAARPGGEKDLINRYLTGPAQQQPQHQIQHQRPMPVGLGLVVAPQQSSVPLISQRPTQDSYPPNISNESNPHSQPVPVQGQPQAPPPHPHPLSIPSSVRAAAQANAQAQYAPPPQGGGSYPQPFLKSVIQQGHSQPQQPQQLNYRYDSGPNPSIQSHLSPPPPPPQPTHSRQQEHVQRVQHQLKLYQQLQQEHQQKQQQQQQQQHQQQHQQQRTQLPPTPPPTTTMMYRHHQQPAPAPGPGPPPPQPPPPHIQPIHSPDNYSATQTQRTNGYPSPIEQQQQQQQPKRASTGAGSSNVVVSPSGQGQLQSHSYFHAPQAQPPPAQPQVTQGPQVPVPMHGPPPPAPPNPPPPAVASLSSGGKSMLTRLHSHPEPQRQQYVPQPTTTTTTTTTTASTASPIGAVGVGVDAPAPAQQQPIQYQIRPVDPFVQTCITHTMNPVQKGLENLWDTALSNVSQGMEKMHRDYMHHLTRERQKTADMDAKVKETNGMLQLVTTELEATRLELGRARGELVKAHLARTETTEMEELKKLRQENEELVREREAWLKEREGLVRERDYAKDVLLKASKFIIATKQEYDRAKAVALAAEHSLAANPASSEDRNRNANTLVEEPGIHKVVAATESPAHGVDNMNKVMTAMTAKMREEHDMESLVEYIGRQMTVMKDEMEVEKTKRMRAEEKLDEVEKNLQNALPFLRRKRTSSSSSNAPMSPRVSSPEPMSAISTTTTTPTIPQKPVVPTTSSASPSASTIPPQHSLSSDSVRPKPRLEDVIANHARMKATTASSSSKSAEEKGNNVLDEALAIKRSSSSLSSSSSVVSIPPPPPPRPLPSSSTLSTPSNQTQDVNATTGPPSSTSTSSNITSNSPQPTQAQNALSSLTEMALIRLNLSNTPSAPASLPSETATAPPAPTTTHASSSSNQYRVLSSQTPAPLTQPSSDPSSNSFAPDKSRPTTQLTETLRHYRAIETIKELQPQGDQFRVTTNQQDSSNVSSHVDSPLPTPPPSRASASTFGLGKDVHVHGDGDEMMDWRPEAQRKEKPPVPVAFRTNSFNAQRSSSGLRTLFVPSSDSDPQLGKRDRAEYEEEDGDDEREDGRPAIRVKVDPELVEEQDNMSLSSSSLTGPGVHGEMNPPKEPPRRPNLTSSSSSLSNASQKSSKSIEEGEVTPSMLFEQEKEKVNKVQASRKRRDDYEEGEVRTPSVTATPTPVPTPPPSATTMTDQQSMQRARVRIRPEVLARLASPPAPQSPTSPQPPISHQLPEKPSHYRHNYDGQDRSPLLPQQQSKPLSSYQHQRKLSKDRPNASFNAFQFQTQQTTKPPEPQHQHQRKTSQDRPSRPPAKLGIKHMDLLYMNENNLLKCRMCLTRRDPPSGLTEKEKDKDKDNSGKATVKRFSANASWDELVSHCYTEHPNACADLEKLTPSQIEERKQRMLKQGPRIIAR